MNSLILASSSPRRKELINLLGLPFKIVVKEVEEKLEQKLSAEENVKALALLKAMTVAKEEDDNLVIGCDTVVSLDGVVIGKPKDPLDAKRILKQLSGKKHKVCTGVAIIGIQDNIHIVFCETTYVHMKALSEAEIDFYISTGEPLDKAGAYGIQGAGALYIEGIEGDYYNVMGLPVHRLYETLRQLNSYKTI